MNRITLNKLVVFGVLAEVIIFLIPYLSNSTIETTFRHAARYSGRLSFIVFLYTFYLYASSRPKSVRENLPLKNFISLFAVLHVIHFGFLALSVYLNDIQLEVPKVIGGSLAYFMIVAAPFFLDKLKTNLQLIYFYYVSLVMSLTFVARLKGDFPGANPYWFHYFGLATMVICCVIFGILIRKSRLK